MERPPSSPSTQRFVLACGLGALIGLMLIGVMIIGFLIFQLDGNDDDKEAQAPSNTPSPLPSGAPTLTITPTASPTATMTPTPTATPTPTPIPPQAIFGPIRQQAWLETAREEIIFPELFADGDRGVVPGGISLKYRAFYDVTAGIDLTLLTLDDIDIDGTTVTITLPDAQVRECIANPLESYYFDRNCSRGPGLGDWPGCRGLESELVEKAQEQIVAYEYENLTNRAYSEAIQVIEGLVRNVGGVEDVIIEQSTEILPVFSVDGTCSALVED